MFVPKLLNTVLSGFIHWRCLTSPIQSARSDSAKFCTQPLHMISWRKWYSIASAQNLPSLRLWRYSFPRRFACWACLPRLNKIRCAIVLGTTCVCVRHVHECISIVAQASYSIGGYLSIDKHDILSQFRSTISIHQARTFLLKRCKRWWSRFSKNFEWDSKSSLQRIICWLSAI